MDLNFGPALSAIRQMAFGFIHQIPYFLMAVLVFAGFFLVSRGVRDVIVGLANRRARHHSVGLVLGRLAQGALILLGLGWNLGLVSGTAMITDAVPLDRRARTQGTVDVGIALSGAGGGLASGLVVAGAGYATLALGGGILALLILPFLARARSATTASART